MWLWKKRNTQTTFLFLVALWTDVCHRAQDVTIKAPEHSIIVSVQEDVLFSVEFACRGTPVIQWNFMSASKRHNIATWKPGVYRNVSEEYGDRLQTHANGSITLFGVVLTDSGYYSVTVTEPSGTSKHAAFILTVTEPLYEDLQYLFVFASVLGALAGFLMISMWFLDKVHRQLKAWQQSRRVSEHNEMELQPL